MSTERRRSAPLEEPGGGPASAGRDALEIDAEERGAAALLAAIELLGIRSEGPESFTVSPSNDPVAFLLDSVADAVSVSRGTSVVYRNRAAEKLQSSGRSFDRRQVLEFRRGGDDYVLEILSDRV
jgi:hypothetical protein